ncbi:MAG: response regulator transcription factor [Umezawaea sp.]
MLRVLVVDDQMLIRAGIVALLGAVPGIEVVGEAADGDKAVTMAAATTPDVVLMDIHLPTVDGITALRRILDTVEPPPKVIMLTTFDVDEYVYAALRAGASGFLLKETEPRHLIDAIHAAASGEMLFAPTVTRRLVEAYLDNGYPASAQERSSPVLAALTPRETEILRLVGTGLSNAEIAEKLTLSESTIKTHLNRTMTKLDVSSRAQAVVVAYETGLVVRRRA